MLRTRLVFLSAVLTAGCATVDPSVCGRFDENRQSTRYDTQYRYSDSDTRKAAESFKTQTTKDPALVRWYTLRVNTPEVRPCEHLYLYKELYLQRDRADDLTFEETREFYTAAGKRIATRKEDMTRQLRAGGYYSAAVPLPIPETAPAGGYKVVTRLTARRSGGKETVLGSASTEFRVVAR